MGSKGRRPIRRDRADRARKLLAAGWPQRKVAAQTGLGRRTIQRIAAGAHRADEQATAARRCQCGAKIVTEQCLSCAAEAAKQAKTGSPKLPPIRRCGRCRRATRDYYFHEPETGRPAAEAICKNCFEPALARATRERVAAAAADQQVLDKSLYAK